ncbi:Ig-like domain-containing protein [Lactiplantibacillus daoliensis]|uniref:Ig-like domain-containing protein n=1 Tax=Lactiplantibacillus daoliensis TaxID=2559916 RepID=A0ABW1ULL8_9LACO|nr:Ig-like domain-containing protein [Lactiplantibacillus daoliensis]
MKNKQILRWLIGLVSLVGLFLVSSLVTPVKASAANYNASDFLTSAQVTNGPDFKPADTIDVQYKLDFGDQQLNNGDTITIDLPSNLKAKKVGDTFDVVDTTGTVIGVAKVTNDGQVVITVNDALEGKTNDKMTLNLKTQYRGDDFGEKEVDFGGGNQSTVNIVENDANLSKKGTLQDDGTVKWTILVDRREISMSNLKISDTVANDQTMLQPITVYNGEWSSNSTYKRRDKINESDYNVSYTDNGFDVAFNDTVSNLIVIDYYTKINDDQDVNSGHKFRNKATMTWSGGTTGGSNSEDANGSVSSSNGNSGIGTGDENGEETTEEPDEDDENTGTIDTDGGTDEVTEPEPTPDPEPTPEPGEESSSSSSNSSSVASSSNSSSSSAAVINPTTDSSSTTGTTSTNKTTTAPANAAPKKQATAKTLPQTNESASDSHALLAIGVLVATLTLGSGALLRHWF